jgi:methyl-accepting chemotaxis protein
MSAGIREIAGSTHEMSGSADQVVSTVSEMSASIREVERLSGESSQAAERVVQEASGSGLAAVGKTMEGMDRIQATVGRSASIVKQLDKRANDVGDILTVINDITDTTSLLALNASILAAQAGEHGRAFGVVAAEIRELAERTNASTREIAAITKAVRADVNMAVEAMGESMGSVAEGTSLASAAERTLRNIIERAEVSRDMGRKIASVTQEQARGMAHVGQTVDGMSQVIRQVNKAIQEQKVGSEMMSRTSEGMRTITEKVKLVAREHATAGQNIVRAVESIRDRVRAIHTATREQEAGSGVVTDSIERINAVLHEFNGMIGGLSSTASSLQKEAEDLRQEISRFNL